MAKRDGEIDVMASILELMAPLDPDAQGRVAAWVHARFVNGHRPSSLMGKGGVINHAASYMELPDFLSLKRPSTKLARLLCLLFWAEARGSDGGVPTRVLNELNRDAPGDRFSDAASIAQGAISEKGYVVRVSPGYLMLTPLGRHIVEAMPH